MTRQHLYYDVSDLNARWDQVPLQGVGDGSLGGVSVLGVGQDPAVAADYPWKEYSDATKALQVFTNAALKDHGYCPISEDGELGPRTCGARKTLQECCIPGMAWPGTCQEFTAPRREPCGPVGPVGPPPTPVPTTDIAPVTRAGAGGGTMWIVGGGLVAAAAIGAAIYMKKGRR